MKKYVKLLKEIFFPTLEILEWGLIFFLHFLFYISTNYKNLYIQICAPLQIEEHIFFLQKVQHTLHVLKGECLL